MIISYFSKSEIRDDADPEEVHFNCNVLKVKQPEKSTVYAADGSIKLTALIYHY